MAVVVAADDDNDIRSLMVMVLERAGHEVVAFANGRDALAAIRDRLPDVVVLDHHMPLVTGGEVRQALHDDPRTAGIPVIIASAGFDESDEVATLPITVVLRKPYLPTTLASTVESLLCAGGTVPDTDSHPPLTVADVVRSATVVGAPLTRAGAGLG